jgi:hypothetical protein
MGEDDILLFFERWIIRVQEQAFITALQPSLNRDDVKFQYNWEPKDITLYAESKPAIVVHEASDFAPIYKGG